MIRARKFLSSFRFAIKGIKHAFRNENNMRFHLLAAIGVVAAGFYTQLTRTEWCIILFAIGFVVSAEIVNTAIEKLVDLVSPEYHPQAGLVKDLAAGAVLVSSFTALLTGVIIFLPYLENGWYLILLP